MTQYPPYRMHRAYFRSILFNVLFFALSAILSIVYIPFLILPHKTFVHLIRFYLFCTYALERVVMDLRHEIRGREHLPDAPPYIVGAKHQSAYETLKLHLLFNDPAIILKRELLKIPLWGMYLKKSAPIAIDRSNPETAIQSIQDGAKNVAADNRPIVIFPQGTRVTPDQNADDKPYKIGIARIQEATDLYIIPMATNAGLFWPRNGFWKSSGTVVFEFLPPIEPGLERSEMLRNLETTIEPATRALMEQAVNTNKKQFKKDNRNAVIAFVAACAIWLGLWFATDKGINQLHTQFEEYVHIKDMKTGGFPVFSKITSPQVALDLPDTYALATGVHIRMPPLPFALRNTQFNASMVLIHPKALSRPIILQNVSGKAKLSPADITIEDTQFQYGGAIIQTFLSLGQNHADGVIIFADSKKLIDQMVADGFIRDKQVPLIKAGLMLYKKGDRYILPIKTRDNVVYVGLAPIYRFPETVQYTRREKPLVP